MRVFDAYSGIELADLVQCKKHGQCHNAEYYKQRAVNRDYPSE